VEDPPLDESQRHDTAAVEALAHNKNAVAQHARNSGSFKGNQQID
jgi:hypothetical protein